MRKYETLLADSVRNLEAARELIRVEIASYPTPISGCDAQFNHLLSERVRISSALHALDNPPFIPTSRQLEPVTAGG